MNYNNPILKIQKHEEVFLISGGRWQVLSYIADITKVIKRWFANTCNMIIEKKIIVKSDTNISSFLWGADGLTDNRDFLNNQLVQVDV